MVVFTNNDNITKDKIKKYINKGERIVLPDDPVEVKEDGIDFIKGEYYYKTTGCKINCWVCGKELVSKCNVGLYDEAVCDECDIKYTRDREYIVSSSDYFMCYSWDRMFDDTYECQECNQTHKYSKPKEGWNKCETHLHSYEGITFTCKCGEHLPLGDYVDKLPKCANCGREYNITINNK